MTRVTIIRGEQSNFLAAVKQATGLTWRELASQCGVDRRTLYNWQQETCRMSYEAMVTLGALSGVSLPSIQELTSDQEARRLAAQKGARRRHKIHGELATPGGRSKGGRRGLAELRRRASLNPERYPGLNNRRAIEVPDQTPRLAELIGILLGDGGITDYQVRVYSNRQKERAYSVHVATLLQELFGLEISTLDRGNTHVVVLSSVAVVEFLLEMGLKRGSKVDQQVGVPHWVFSDPSLIRACARGLMDTDGGPYPHSYIIRGQHYQYLKLCFTSHSRPLLADMARLLQGSGFSPRSNNTSTVSLYRQSEVQRYYQEVGTNNAYHLARVLGFGQRFGIPQLSEIGLVGRG